MPTSQTAPQSTRNKELRRRRVVAGLLGCGLVVGATGAFTAVIWPGFAIATGAAAETSVEVLPRQYLRFQPIPRDGEQSALEAALPDVVEGWVQSGISVHREWQGDDAIEAWSVLYLDGSPLLANTMAAPEAVTESELGKNSDLAVSGSFGKSTATASATATGADLTTSVDTDLEAKLREEAHVGGITVTIGQWRTADAAKKFLNRNIEPLTDPVLKGDVFRSDEKVGHYVLAAADANGVPMAPGDTFSSAHHGVMWWRNGTVVVRITGPLGLLSQFYSAYPL